MDAVYSLSLLISLVAGTLGTTVFILVAAQSGRPRKSDAKVAQAAIVFGATALLFGMISVSAHLDFGHGPDSDAAMTTLEFFGHHKAYWLVLILIVLSYQGWRLAGRLQDKDFRAN